MNILALFAILVALIASYFVGSLLLWACRVPLRKENFYDTFVRTIVGMLSVVSVFAIVKTCGNTILWGFWIVGILYLVYASRNKLIDKASVVDYFSGGWKSYSSLAIMLLLGIAFFVFQGSFFYATPMNKMPHGDYAFYATLQGLLNNYGVESATWENVVFGGSCAPSPYHYFDIWLSLIFVLCSFGQYEAQVVIVQSVFMAVLSIGVIAFTCRYTKNVIMQSLSVLSIFFAGLLFIEILPQSRDFVFSNSCSLKYCSASIFVVWAAILMSEKNDSYRFALLCLPVLNVIMAPAVFIVVVLSLLWKMIKERNIKPQMLPLAGVFGLATFIAVFYFAQAGSSASGGLGFSSLTDAFAEDKLKPVKIFGGALVIMASLYFYYLIPALCVLFTKQRKQRWIKIKENSLIFGCLLGFVFVGLFVWSLTHVVADSIQFFMVIAMTSINLIMWLMILLCHDDSSKSRYLIYAFVLLLFAANMFLIKKVPFYRYSEINYDETFVTEVSEEIKALDNPVGIYCRDTSEFVDYWDFNNFGVGSKFKHFVDELYITSVFPYPDLEKYPVGDRQRIQKATDAKPFTKFCNDSKLPTYEEQVLDFARKHDCRFVCLSERAVLPSTLLPFVKKEYEDKQSRTKFVLLEVWDEHAE